MNVPVPGKNKSAESFPTPPDNPYPGLRAFESYESQVFFGRERHTNDVLERLAASQLVAVIGPSGCGKSSLIRAGVIPALQSGHFYQAGAKWQVVVMRPENAPIWNMASELAKISTGVDKFDPEVVNRIWSTLMDDTSGLSNVREASGVPSDTNLLVLVDQFEELFKIESEAHLTEVKSFITLLLDFFHQTHSGLYAIVTMRTDHLGDCVTYPGLAEAINSTFYLTPNLNSEEIEEAITLPSVLCGYELENGLSKHIVTAMETEGNDQLPLMQHVMRRVFQSACASHDKSKILTRENYEKFGAISNALNVHGDQLLRKIPASEQPLVELMFKQLTTRREGADVRRPASFGELATVAQLTTDEQKARLRKLVDLFRGPDALFLRPQFNEREIIKDKHQIDIIHECLIRKWTSLGAWVQQEWESRKHLENLVEEVDLRSSDDGLMDESDFLNTNTAQIFEAWQQKQNPNTEWARRYGIQGPKFDKAMSLLKRSIAYFKDQQRTTLIRRTVSTASVALLVGVSIMATAWWLNSLAREHQEQAHFEASLKTATVLDQNRALPALGRLLYSWEEEVRARTVTDNMTAWREQQTRVFRHALDFTHIPLQGSLQKPSRVNATGRGRARRVQASLDLMATGRIYRTVTNIDGTRHAILARNFVILFNSDWKEIYRWPFNNPRSGKSQDIQFGPKNRLLYVDKSGRVVSLAEGQAPAEVLATQINHNIESVRFSDSAGLVAAVGRDSGGRWRASIYQLDADAPRIPVTSFELSGKFISTKENVGLKSVSLVSGNVDFIAASFTDGAIGHWTISPASNASHNPNFEMRFQTAGNIKLSPSGDWIALLPDNSNKVEIWHLETALFQFKQSHFAKYGFVPPTRSHYRHYATILSLHFVGENEALILAEDGKATLWRYKHDDAWGAYRDLQRATNRVLTQTVSRDGVLTVIDRKLQIHRWHLYRSPAGLISKQKWDQPISASAVARDAGIVAIATRDGRLQVFEPGSKTPGVIELKTIDTKNVTTGETGSIAEGDESIVTTLAISKDASVIVGGDTRGFVATAVRHGGKASGGNASASYKVLRYQMMSQPVLHVALSADAMHLAIVGADGTLHLAERTDRADEGSEWKIVPLDRNGSHCSAVFVGDGQTLLAGTIDGNIEAFDLTKGKARGQIRAKLGGGVVSQITLSPMGDLVLSTVGPRRDGPGRCGTKADAQPMESGTGVALHIHNLGGRRIALYNFSQNPGTGNSASRVVDAKLTFFPNSMTALVTLVREQPAGSAAQAPLLDTKIAFVDFTPHKLGMVEQSGGLSLEDFYQYSRKNLELPSQSYRRVPGTPSEASYSIDPVAPSRVPAQVTCGSQACWLIAPTVKNNELLLVGLRKPAEASN